jgi:hypothetical protein
MPGVSLTERNGASTPAARQSSRLDLRFEDVADEALFNRILWATVKPGVPYPGLRRGAVLEALRR